MGKSIYLINPAADFPIYYSGDAFAASGLPATAIVADLTTTTVAAMVPSGFEVRLCDEEIARADFDTPADFVGITGKLAQVQRMIELAQQFRARGKTVLIGGPFATLSPEVVRPYCDILVRGEMEEISERLFADLARDRWQDEYDGGRPDITASPVPRWDLYPNERAIEGALQTSRGCPFECEFCDVIQYLGRRQRFKTVPQIRAEAEALYRIGYRRILLSDDNFTVARPRAKEVLAELRDWNRAHAASGWVSFHTQASVELAEDEELMCLCADAGLSGMLVGIETSNEDSLRETKKHQNLRRRLSDSLESLVGHGINVRAGLMVGFDADGPDIFERLLEFAQSVPVPFFPLAVVNAVPATPLLARLEREGRVVAGKDSAPVDVLDTNIVPLQMTREELLAGVRWLANQLYRPAAFGHRLRHFIRKFGSERRPVRPAGIGLTGLRVTDRDMMQLIKNLRNLGPQEDALVREAFRLLTRDTATNTAIMEALANYVQVRHCYAQGNIWDPSITLPIRSVKPLRSLPVLASVP
jgi:hypothetical protein